ncbi:glutaminyl-tRNA synthetase [Fusarium albosuccineum]|uniref:glutamine--tRNA ligase n=1 Tax=Fusarium albosuccineum TaxID=1237068 RepID=A0A8H4P7P5_9HYPO|nr:glutaminyl-tRNA synthetase [Fusarium albosuccineum]
MASTSHTPGEQAPAAPVLVLDEETGEMVSRNELKKRSQKRARKAAKLTRAKEASTTGANTDATPPQRPSKSAEAPIDPDAMFKQGFLAEVFEELPIKPVVTRFPPEPNGYLHLGHAKAMAVDFGFARFHGGKTVWPHRKLTCYTSPLTERLRRLDDTNPDKEDESYTQSIIDMVKWLGFTPTAITHSSDNFQRLYELAQELIKKEKAYVCHCSDTEVKLQRGGKDGKEGPRFRCKHAEQDVSTNLAKFHDMHDGKYEPQTAFLRMKQDIQNGNPQMWDLAAYRIPKKQIPHPRAPDWKIFPTYDFTHCLCDSFEGITHSLCTTEFVLSRESYEWLNKTLGVYEPTQREFGRLNLTGTLMSKRALTVLVDQQLVQGWDDPRLYTLIALKRRGVPPGAILSFINELGVTTSRTFIQVARFEQSVRRYLEPTVPRLMLILDPIPITISNFDGPTELDVPFSPKDPSFGSHRLTVTQTVYIDRSDFRETDSPDYFRLAPRKIVGLLHVPFPIKATSYTKDETTSLVTGVEAIFQEGVKPKTWIQWVAEGSAQVEARIYAPLFKSEDPSAVEGGFINDINPESKTTYRGALIERGISEVRERAPWPATKGEAGDISAPEAVRFQAVRVGYFSMDSDSTSEKLVLNRIVSLKEDSGKN